MTRAAARAGFERFVNDAITAAGEAFAVGNALRNADGPPGVMDRLLSNSSVVEERVVRPELDAYEQRILDQFTVTLDALESDESFDAFADRILAQDSYYDALRSDLSPARRNRVERALIDRQRRFAEAIEPLVVSDADAFWPAVRDAYDEASAERLVTEQFRFTDPLDEFPDAFVFATEIDPGELFDGLGGLLASTAPSFRVEYTAETHRALERAERRVIHDTTRELRRQFESA